MIEPFDRWTMSYCELCKREHPPVFPWCRHTATPGMGSTGWNYQIPVDPDYNYKT